MNTRVYDHSFNVLKSVLKDHFSFSIAVKNNSKGVSKDEFSAMSSLAGIFLRNYFAIKVIAEAVAKSLGVSKDSEEFKNKQAAATYSEDEYENLLYTALDKIINKIKYVAQ